MRLGILATILLAILAAGCGNSEGDPVDITGFEAASGEYYAGDEVVSSMKIKNNRGSAETFWIGYSVQDETGTWQDAAAQPVRLDPGEESKTQERFWSTSENDPPMPGTYKVNMSVWDQQPGESGASRLASAEKTDAFTMIEFEEDFVSLNRGMWNESAKQLGLGSLRPSNVSTEDGRLRLKIPANTFDGGEIKSKSLYQYGSYRARVKVADAPSSLTGFFLYRPPDFENELDIEIFNDPAGRILFTTYSNGEETNNVRKKLPFDPTASFHDYRFDFYPGRAEFYVDGELMHSFDKDLPQDPMNLYLNAWFPTWLSGDKPDKDSYTYVEWIQH